MHTFIPSMHSIFLSRLLSHFKFLVLFLFEYLAPFIMDRVIFGNNYSSNSSVQYSALIFLIKIHLKSFLFYIYVTGIKLFPSILSNSILLFNMCFFSFDSTLFLV